MRRKAVMKVRKFPKRRKTKLILQEIICRFYTNKQINLNKKTCIIISGPTGSGKTDLAIDMALRLGASIISADSRQCYKEMNIGVARPSIEQLNRAPHYFIASHSIYDEVNANSFERYALEKAEELFQSSDTIIMAGGTGLYIRAFAEGLDDIPDVCEETERTVHALYIGEGLPGLVAAIQKEDSLYFSKGEIQNPQRTLRALCVMRETGKSILAFHSAKKKPRPFQMRHLYMDTPRQELYDRINHRVDSMMEAGLEKEARELYPYHHLNALQTVGYKELFDYFENKISLEEALEQIKKNTRHYAKRQMTWFRKYIPTVPSL